MELTVKDALPNLKEYEWIQNGGFCSHCLLFGLVSDNVLSVIGQYSHFCIDRILHGLIQCTFWYCEPLLNWKEFKNVVVINLACWRVYCCWDDVMIREEKRETSRDQKFVTSLVALKNNSIFSWIKILVNCIYWYYQVRYNILIVELWCQAI